MSLHEITGKLREQAERLDSDWKRLSRLMNLTPSDPRLQLRVRSAEIHYMERAGKLIQEAAMVGGFGGADELRRLAEKMPLDGFGGTGVFFEVGVVQHWLPDICPAFVHHPVNCVFKWIDAMKAVADHLEASTDKPIDGDENRNAILTSLLLAIKNHGPTADPETIRKAAKVNRKLARTLLRELEQSGKYQGFSRPIPARYRNTKGSSVPER